MLLPLNFLPSKKFSVILLSLLVAVGMLWVASYFSKQQTAQKNNTGISAQSGKTVVAEKDSDGDGFPDWQESLAGSNPNDQKSKPNQFALQASTSTDSVVPSDDTPLIPADITPTETVLENFGSYFKSQMVPGTDTTLDMSDRVTNLLTNDGALQAQKLKALTNPYSKNDLVIDDGQTLTSYFNTVAGTIQKNFPDQNKKDPDYEDEMVILLRLGALAVGKDSIEPEVLKDNLDKLEPYKMRYRHAARDLNAIKVPTAAIDIHLALSNSMVNMALSLEAIQLFPRDPIMGMLGMKLYQSQLKSTPDLLAKTKSFISNNKIVFKKGDPGYLFQNEYLKAGT